ncbi:MAG: hypothetical protein EA403_11860 [Spirochaetaceae bacterium]|nr:MAG: hypothetical protein EA403_11860 [Spirochaetaceae bacterium]
MAAQRAEVRAVIAPRAVSVDVLLIHDGTAVIEALESGMRSEVAFEIRLYRPLDGLAGLLGDQLVAEYHPSFIAFRDRFTREYVIESPVGAQRRFASRDEFLREFFAIRSFAIPTGAIPEINEHYVLCRVELRPVKLVPALRLLEALRPGETIATPWERLDLYRLDSAGGKPVRSGGTP